MLLNSGRHNGEQIVNRDFLEFATKPHPRSAGHYGAHIWLNPAIATASEDAILADEHPVRKKKDWLREIVPHDAYYMSGHDGQSVFVLPADKLVITRLGFTQGPEEYTHALMKSLLQCVERKKD